MAQGSRSGSEAVKAQAGTPVLDELRGILRNTPSKQWREEIRKRMGELDAGEVETVAWDDVRSRLKATLRNRAS